MLEKAKCYLFYGSVVLSVMVYRQLWHACYGMQSIGFAQNVQATRA